MRRRIAMLTMMAVAVVVPGTAQTVDEILAKNIESRGGIESLKSVISMRSGGTIELTAMGMTGGITVTMARPDKRLVKTELMGMEIIEAYDGQEGWSIRPPMAGGTGKPETMSPEALKVFKGAGDIDGYWVDYKEKGHKVELVGTEDLDGKQVYHLKASLKGGGVVDAYLDAETGLDVRYRLREFLPDLGREADLETRFSDFKEAGGVNIYHTVEQLVDGTPSYRISVQQVEMNPDIPEGFFAKPEPAP